MKDFDFMKFFKGILFYIPWKQILKDAYKKLRVKLAEKVASSDPKWDDWAFEVIDKMVLRFLDEKLLEGEKDRAVLVTEAKNLLTEPSA